MTLHLYHGPKSQNKETRFLECLKQRAAQSLILTPHAMGLQNRKTRLANHKDSTIFLQVNLKTLPDFLFELIKINRHRGHFADNFLCEYLIFILLEKHDSGWLKRQTNPLQSLREIHQLYLQVKKSQDLFVHKKNFGLPLANPLIYKIFQSYGDILKKNHFYDEGDLIAESLKLLQNNNCLWPSEHNTIFIDNIYPLGIGERALLRAAQSCFPNLDWHVFYDEDFDRPSDLLSLAYEDLGQMADHNEYIKSSEVRSHPLYEAPSPAHEIFWVKEQILRDHQAGISYADIAVACPADYAEPLAQQLEMANIPCGSFHKKKSGDVFILQDNSSLTELASKKHVGVDQILLQESLRLLQEQLGFAKKLFATEQTAASQSAETLFLHHYLLETPLHKKPSPHQLLMVSHADALNFTPRKIYAMGWQMESFLHWRETTSLQNPELAQKEWAEPLALPQYQFRVALEHLLKLLADSDVLYLSRSLTDFSGKATTHMPLGQTHKIIATKNQNTAVAEKKQKFPKLNKTVFSVSELQLYANCPYKYYASNVLKLAPTEEAAIDTTAKTLGTFLHNTLQTLVSENFAAYHLKIKNHETNPVWENLLDTVITNGIKTNTEWNQKPKHILDSLQKKIRQTILNFNNQEQSWFAKKEKNTLPQHAEWPFRLQIENITITGRIDRIDLSDDGCFFSVFDYKTGSVASLSDIKKLVDIQMPIYILAVSEGLYSKSLPSAGIYYSLRKESSTRLIFADSVDIGLAKSQYHLPKNFWIDWQHTIKERVLQLANNIIDGNFTANPVDEKLCKHCDFRKFCGRHDVSS